eukprot:scaffold508_cov554-Prasinococcus_capsulatus_cf.AAC.21
MPPHCPVLVARIHPASPASPSRVADPRHAQGWGRCSVHRDHKKPAGPSTIVHTARAACGRAAAFGACPERSRQQPQHPATSSRAQVEQLDDGAPDPLREQQGAGCWPRQRGVEQRQLQAGCPGPGASLTNSLLSSHLLAKEQLEFLNRDGRAHASVASPPVSDDSNSHTTPTTLLEHPTLETKPSSTTRSAQPQRTDASARTGSSGNAAVTESEVLQETELDGSVVMPGLDNLVESAAECQRSCRASFDQNIVGCNVWVYSERTRQCWLKRQDDVANGLRSRAKGHGVPWSSGYIKGPIVTNPFQEQVRTQQTCGAPGRLRRGTLFSSCLSTRTMLAPDE